MDKAVFLSTEDTINLFGIGDPMQKRSPKPVRNFHHASMLPADTQYCSALQPFGKNLPRATAKYFLFPRLSDSSQKLWLLAAILPRRPSGQTAPDSRWFYLGETAFRPFFVGDFF